MEIWHSNICSNVIEDNEVVFSLEEKNSNFCLLAMYQIQLNSGIWSKLL